MEKKKLAGAVRGVLIPYGVYFIVYTFSGLLFRQLLAERAGAAFCLLLAALCTLPFMIWFYRTYPTPRAAFVFDRAHIGRDILWTLFGILCCSGLNILLTRFGRALQTASYAEARDVLTDGSMAVIVLTEVLAVPLVEEILFRGIIENQVALRYGFSAGIIVSAVFFAILHGNLLQGLYALLSGLALGAAYAKTGRLFVPYVSHAVCNLLAILFSE